ncbi:hypothetical protein MRB56_07625 [Halomonas cupida]|uniref:hypothetical protein n=1 Tax=Halomonas cupida TaxID=44933 RepID=UPI0039B5645A
MATLRYAIALLSLTVGLSAAAQADSDQQLDVDPDSGLVMAEGWETVKANCSVCHSISLATQNRGNRKYWADTIQWMQETQGLWPFAPEMEATILDYLAEHYGPRENTRRSNLPPHLMPQAPSTESDAG